MATISLTLRTNLDKASKEIKDLGKVTEEQRKKMEAYQKKFKDSRIDNFILKNNRAAAAISAMRGPLEAARSSKRALQNQMINLIKGGFDPQSAALKKITAAYDKAAKEADDLTAAQKKNKKETVSTKDAVFGLAAAFGAAALAVRRFSAVFGEFREFEKQIKNVTTLTDELSFEDIKKDIMSLEPVLGTAAELTNGLYQALSAGVEAGRAVEFVSVSAKFATAALTDTATATDVITTALNAYGLGAEKAGAVSDIFFKAIEKGKITGAELAQNLGKSIPIYASMGIGLDELNAGLAALTAVGVDAAESSTQLNAIISGFVKPSAAMTRALEEQGYASGSALIDSENLAGALKFLDTATAGSKEELARLMPNIRGFRGVLALAANGGVKFAETLEAIQDASGATNKAFDKQVDATDRMQAQLTRARTAVGELTADLVDKLAPVITRIAEVVEDFPLESMIPVIISVAGVIATLLTPAFIQLAAAVNANPLFLIVTAIAVLISGIVLLIKNWDRFVIFYSETIEKLKVRFLIFGDKLKTSFFIVAQKLKLAFLSFATILLVDVLRSIQKLLNLAAKIPGIGEKFAGLSSKVKGFQDSLLAAREKTKKEVDLEIAAAKTREKILSENHEKKLTRLKEEQEARRNSRLEQQKADADELASLTEGGGGGTGTGGGGGGGDAAGQEAATLQERLAVLNNLEALALQERTASFGEFLQSRMVQEGITGQARIAFLEEEAERIANLDSITGAERLAAASAVEAEITAVKSQENAKRQELIMATVGHAKKAADMAIGFAKQTAQLASVITDGQIKKEEERASKKIAALDKELLGEEEYARQKEAIENGLNKKKKKAQREQAVANKAIALFEIGVNTAAAVIRALADPGGIPGVALSIAAGVTGLLQAGIVAATPIPSFQTGGNFTVPNLSTQADSVAFRASPGENIEVTPRGENRKKTITVNVLLDSRVVYRAVQDGFDGGEITVSAQNIAN